MKKLRITFGNATFLILVFSLFFAFNSKAQDNSKRCFYSAKDEIEAMLKGEKPLDYERAVFITENAYYENKLSLDDFKNFIELSTSYSFELAKRLYASSIATPQRNVLISKDSSDLNLYRAAINYGIFKLITDTTIITINKNYFAHLPFMYPNSDPLATSNWKYSQVANLYLGKSRTGNCAALTSLFKIISLRLNSNANLCTTQGHIFITHPDENGIAYNVELASKAFPGTGSIETITHTTDEAARNGVSMRELNLKQSIGICLINLAKGYEYKFKIDGDDFMLQCAELALKHDKLNLNAMLLKAEVLESMLIQQNKSISLLKSSKDFIRYETLIKDLYKLGYREMPLEMKNLIIASVSGDKNYPIVNDDKTYYPFYKIDKSNKRSTTLSNGLFEETDVYKPKEKYFRTIFDVKMQKVTAFEKRDSLYNNYYYDPVVFAWCIDPLFRKYPDISPYAAFVNNPIYFIDPDGADVIGGDDFMKKNSNTAAFKIFTQSSTATTFLKQFASSNGNLFSSPQSGALARHNIYFDTKTGGDYGWTRLKVINDKGKAVDYKPGMKVDENTKFQLNIGVNVGAFESEGDAGFKAGVINHEIFAHAEAYANVLAQWEDRANNGMTADQFQAQLNALDKSAEQDHENLNAGKVSNFNKTVKEILNYFKTSNTTNKESSDETQFKKISEEDAPGSTK